MANTIRVSDDCDSMIEKIRSDSEFDVTKKAVVEKAVEEYESNR